MENIMAIDPGPDKSGLVIFDYNEITGSYTVKSAVYTNNYNIADLLLHPEIISLVVLEDCVIYDYRSKFNKDYVKKTIEFIGVIRYLCFQRSVALEVLTRSEIIKALTGTAPCRGHKVNKKNVKDLVYGTLNNGDQGHLKTDHLIDAMAAGIGCIRLIPGKEDVR